MHAKTLRSLAVLGLAAFLLMGCPGKEASDPAPAPSEEPSTSAETPKFTVAWSIYVGWMPWEYAQTSGILKKWADKYGIEIELIRMDYIPSVEAYVAKQVDAAVMTNMECLNMPAASGIDSTALILGDYSNGNDAILTRDNLGVKDLGGQTVSLVELSVSHYLLARALETNGMSEDQVTLQNTSDADIGPIFIANESQKAVVTWNPIVMELEQTPGVSKVFTSADIPGEIIDMMVVRTEVLEANPELGKALTGAWYETMALISGGGEAADEAIAAMAESSGTDSEGYKAQLATTAMYYEAQAAVDYAKSTDVQDTMNFVRTFCATHGLLGDGVSSEDAVGVSFPDGTVQGDANNVKMRFDASYMEMAAAGSL